MHSLVKDITGQRFGRLLAIQISEMRPVKSGHLAYWLCQCDCGVHKSISGSSLRGGYTQSCGCLWKEIRAYGANRTHGKTGTREFNAYYSMKSRCLDPKNKEYLNYGARGISICDRWLVGDGSVSGIECFLSDMGLCPNGQTLERKNVDGNYEPGNCKWATLREQARNRRNTAKDGDVTVAELADRHGIKYHTLMDRYRSGDRGTVLVRPVKQNRRWHGSEEERFYLATTPVLVRRAEQSRQYRLNKART